LGEAAGMGLMSRWLGWAEGIQPTGSIVHGEAQSPHRVTAAHNTPSIQHSPEGL